MVIGFDAKRAFQNDTGLGNYSRILICGIAQEHQDVHAVLYSPNMSGNYRSYFSGFANISTRQPSGWDRHIPNLWHGFGIGLHLHGDKVTLYHGLSHELPHGIPKDIKRVVTMHDLFAWRYPQYYRPLERSVYRAKQRHSCKIADMVVAVSEQTKRDLIEILHLPEEKIRVIYQTCDQIFWRPVTQDEKDEVREHYHLPDRYFISVGTIEERKNQIAVVEALASLPADIHLVIVGRANTRYHADLMRVVRSRNLETRVRILSRADFDDFPALYANAIGSVYVSHCEGFAIPIVESFCCDTPVIASNCSSMPEAAGDAALLVAPNDSSAIAQAMRQLIDDDSLRQELIAKGRRQRQRFTPKAIVDQFYNLYRELLNK